MAGGHKTAKSKNDKNLMLSRNGVTSVTPFPFAPIEKDRVILLFKLYGR